MKIFITLITFFLVAKPCFSQDGEYVEVRDLETWSSAQVNLELNKKLTLGLQGQVRFDKNSSELDRYLTQFTTDYNVTKKIGIGVGLRYTNKNDNEGKNQGHEHFLRYQIDGNYKHKIGRFGLKYRLRYSYKEQIDIPKEDKGEPINYFRFKAAIGYNFKKWKLDPVFAAEIFNRYVKDDDEDNGFDAYRLTIGSNYKVKGFGKIGLHYRMEKEISSYYPKTANIILLKYVYTFKR